MPPHQMQLSTWCDWPLHQTHIEVFLSQRMTQLASLATYYPLLSQEPSLEQVRCLGTVLLLKTYKKCQSTYSNYQASQTTAESMIELQWMTGSLASCDSVLVHGKMGYYHLSSNLPSTIPTL